MTTWIIAVALVYVCTALMLIGLVAGTILWDLYKEWSGEREARRQFASIDAQVTEFRAELDAEDWHVELDRRVA